MVSHLSLWICKVVFRQQEGEGNGWAPGSASPRGSTSSAGADLPFFLTFSQMGQPPYTRHPSPDLPDLLLGSCPTTCAVTFSSPCPTTAPLTPANQFLGLPCRLRRLRRLQTSPSRRQGRVSRRFNLHFPEYWPSAAHLLSSKGQTDRQFFLLHQHLCSPLCGTPSE